MTERMTEEEIAELLVRRTGRHGTVERLCTKAHAEIMALRAETQRSPSRNTKTGDTT